MLLLVLLISSSFFPPSLRSSNLLSSSFSLFLYAYFCHLVIQHVFKLFHSEVEPEAKQKEKINTHFKNKIFSESMNKWIIACKFFFITYHPTASLWELWRTFCTCWLCSEDQVKTMWQILKVPHRSSKGLFTCSPVLQRLANLSTGTYVNRKHLPFRVTESSFSQAHVENVKKMLWPHCF